MLNNVSLKITSGCSLKAQIEYHRFLLLGWGDRGDVNEACVNLHLVLFLSSRLFLHNYSIWWLNESA